MTEPNTEKTDRDTFGLITWLAWVGVVVLSFSVMNAIREEIGDLIVNGPADFLPVLNGALTGLVRAMPSVLIAFALVDFAQLFSRYHKGDIFTDANTKTLRKGADSLVWSAIWSAFISPNILRWIEGEHGGFLMRISDLALGVGIMGLALHGFGVVLKHATALKSENDSFV